MLVIRRDADGSVGDVPEREEKVDDDSRTENGTKPHSASANPAIIRINLRSLEESHPEGSEERRIGHIWQAAAKRLADPGSPKNVLRLLRKKERYVIFLRW
jgi:hypothetical protein